MQELHPEMANPRVAYDILDEESYVEFECGTRINMEEARGKIELISEDEIEQNCTQVNRFREHLKQGAVRIVHEVHSAHSDVKVSGLLVRGQYQLVIEGKKNERWSGLNEQAAIEQLAVLADSGYRVPDRCIKSVKEICEELRV